MVLKSFYAWYYLLGLILIDITTSYATAAANSRPLYKVAYINSYHSENVWSKTILDTFKQNLPKNKFHVAEFHMDTKRGLSATELDSVIQQTRHFIQQSEADLIIAADDNASKYVISPYYKNSTTPVVFIGINFDASIYGYPYTNTTGLVESGSFSYLISALKKILPATIQYKAIFTSNTTSQKKQAYYQTVVTENVEYLTVNNFEQWQQAIKEWSSKDNVIVMDNIMSLSGFNLAAAQQTIIDHSQNLIANLNRSETQVSHITYDNLAQEQGLWAAKTTLKLFNGQLPEKIPVSTSLFFKLYINQALATDSNITIPDTFYRLPHEIAH